VISSWLILAISAVRSSSPIEPLKARNVVPAMMMDDKVILSWRFEEDMAEYERSAGPTLRQVLDPA